MLPKTVARRPAFQKGQAAAYTRRGASQSVYEQEVAEWQSDRDAALRYVEWYRQRPVSAILWRNSLPWSLTFPRADPYDL